MGGSLFEFLSNDDLQNVHIFIKNFQLTGYKVLPHKENSKTYVYYISGRVTKPDSCRIFCANEKTRQRIKMILEVKELHAFTKYVVDRIYPKKLALMSGMPVLNFEAKIDARKEYLKIVPGDDKYFYWGSSTRDRANVTVIDYNQ